MKVRLGRGRIFTSLREACNRVNLFLILSPWACGPPIGIKATGTAATLFQQVAPRFQPSYTGSGSHLNCQSPERRCPRQCAGHHLPKFRQAARIAASALVRKAATPRPLAFGNPLAVSHMRAAERRRNDWRAVCTSSLNDHVTHLLLANGFRATLDTLRPIGRALGTRTAVLLGACSSYRSRIGFGGQLERCDVYRRDR
jgi:hypothetical protein